MVVYRTVIWKKPEDVNVPEGVDKETFTNNHKSWKDDFENNYKSSVRRISRVMPHEIETTYDDFKKKIDEATIDWSNVKMLETRAAYYLFVDA